MAPVLFGAQAVIVLGGVIALAIFLRRRLPARWRSWVWGALAFIASQVARTPLLIGLTVLSQTAGLNFGTEGNFWFNTLFLAFTAGMFEEPARYLMLRFLGKETRGWHGAVMFGAGHGGIEAILLVGGAAISNLFVLLNADVLLAQTRAAAPTQVEALVSQIQALQGVTIGLIGASLIERAFAIMLHIGLSVMVMRAVEGRGIRWSFVAILIHGAANAVALVANRFGGIVAAEATVGVIGLLLLAFTLSQRPRDRSSSAIDLPA
jgi:uncharacterized membrane protein YhfC